MSGVNRTDTDRPSVFEDRLQSTSAELLDPDSPTERDLNRAYGMNQEAVMIQRRAIRHAMRLGTERCRDRQRRVLRRCAGAQHAQRAPRIDAGHDAIHEAVANQATRRKTRWPYAALAPCSVTVCPSR